MEFQTMSPEGLLLRVPGSNGVDFFQLAIVENQLVLEWNLGSGIGRIKSGNITVGQWHTVTISRKDIDATMKIDDRSEIHGKSQGLFRGLDTGSFAYIGNVPNENVKAFFGCIKKLTVKKDEIDFGMLESVGVSKCGLH